MATTPTAAPILALEALEKEYGHGEARVHALRGVDLSIERGELVVLMGPSGSGKTTLLNLIGCVDVPTTGEVKVLGTSTSSLKDAALTDLRLRHIGFIFQSFNLIPSLSAFQNVEVPLLLGSRMSSRERRARITELMERVGLAPHMSRRPAALSGGQQQRVAIARALVSRPALILADEPTANLDRDTGDEVMRVMNELNKEEGTTFLFSTHDEHVLRHAKRVLRLADGKIVENRHVDEERRPSHEDAS